MKLQPHCPDRNQAPGLFVSQVQHTVPVLKLSGRDAPLTERLLSCQVQSCVLTVGRRLEKRCGSSLMPGVAVR